MLREERKVYEARCENFLRRLRDDRFDLRLPLNAEFGWSKDPVPFPERLSLQYRPITEGEVWGHTWESAWFHLTAPIPEEWANDEVALQLNLSGESLIFEDNGCPFFGLTGISVFDEFYTKDLFLVPREMRRNGKIDLWVEAAANKMFGLDRDPDPRPDSPILYGEFTAVAKQMRLCKFNREAWSLYYDFQIILGLYRMLPEEDYRRRQLLEAMNRAVSVYAGDPANAAAARAELAPQLAHRANDSALSVAAVGHAHIDVGWLWPVRESIRKTARTFSSAIALIKQYPGYIFGASQPQLYQFVKDHYPALYAKIKEAVAEGRWELQGGMWVEADCNIISGESMVRQFLHGKNFYRDEFGADVRGLWIPDVFGYSAALPQIIRKSGCDWFLTQKISWNQNNLFPHHTFRWRGIDGTEVLTHFPPENNYNSFVTPEILISAQNRFSESGTLPEFVSLFGIGNGGGGPAEQHLERAMRLQDLEGCPKYRFSKTEDFFRRLQSLAPELAEWEGELYLEMHRGTLTTQARTKKNNRMLEQHLTELEFIASMLPPEQYPREALDKMWKTLLINQFHDIIPGSSIREVYKVTEQEHADALRQCRRLTEDALQKLTTPEPGAITVANSLSRPWRGVLDLPAGCTAEAFSDENGNLFPVQKGRVRISVPASSLTALRPAKRAKNTVRTGADRVLENDRISYKFDTNGTLISAYDKAAQRELIPAGKPGNLFGLYFDHPNRYEAWDIDVFYRDTPPVHPENVQVSTVESSDVESVLTISGTIGSSPFTQRVSLRPDSMRLDFETRVDFRECRKQLRVSFGAAIRTSEASYEIQYGFVRRPLHENTSWEKAKFEVPSHRYFDLSEYNYGVALLNDCKYGCRARREELDL
ncbi:MAG: alpha-mannosidase [Lentisphaeria bacterium]|nr:alpha-mannosidase [Lentisphaeria bacterium]